jgi:hypothetical protein
MWNRDKDVMTSKNLHFGILTYVKKPSYLNVVELFSSDKCNSLASCLKTILGQYPTEMQFLSYVSVAQDSKLDSLEY